MNIHNIPSELRTLFQWVGWRRRPDPKHPDKPHKVPVKVNPKPLAGAQYQEASSTNRHDWSTFDHAIAALEAGKVAGIGFVFSGDDGYFGIDLDNCIVEGVIATEARRIIDMFPGAYWEVSPSGNGVHGIGKGRKPEGAGCKIKTPWPGVGAIEIYHHARYFTVTGEKVAQR
jgi:putative DNA primase/helicase